MKVEKLADADWDAIQRDDHGRALLYEYRVEEDRWLRWTTKGMVLLSGEERSG